MKKTLSLLLTLLLALSLSLPALAFTEDVNVDYVDDINTLVDIGAVKGVTDDSFRPKDNLTREQAAKIVTYLTLGKDAAGALTSPANSRFADMTTNRWSTPFVEFCADEGIVSGTGGGRFDPTSQITDTEAAKMLLVALGYDAYIEGLVGFDWATNVSVSANAQKLSLNEGGLTREEGAALFHSALYLPLVKYGSDGKAAPYMNESAGTHATLANTVHAEHFQNTPVKIVSGDGKLTMKDVIEAYPIETGAVISYNGQTAPINPKAGEEQQIIGGDPPNPVDPVGPGGSEAPVDPDAPVDPVVPDEPVLPVGLTEIKITLLAGSVVPSDNIGAGAAFERGGHDIQIFDKNGNGKADFYAVVPTPAE